MFKMRDQILCVFKFVLRLSSEFITDAFHKSPKIVAIFTEEGIRFFLGYNNIRSFFLRMLAIILSLARSNTVSKDIKRKYGAIIFIGSSHIKMSFALLVKLVIILMQFTKIQIEKSIFKKLLI